MHWPPDNFISLYGVAWSYFPVLAACIWTVKGTFYDWREFDDVNVLCRLAPPIMQNILSLSWNTLYHAHLSKRIQLLLSHAVEENIFFKATATRTKSLLQVNFIFQQHELCVECMRTTSSVGWISPFGKYFIFLSICDR